MTFVSHVHEKAIYAPARGLIPVNTYINIHLNRNDGSQLAFNLNSKIYDK